MSGADGASSLHIRELSSCKRHPAAGRDTLPLTRPSFLTGTLQVMGRYVGIKYFHDTATGDVSESILEIFAWDTGNRVSASVFMALKNYMQQVEDPSFSCSILRRLACSRRIRLSPFLHRRRSSSPASRTSRDWMFMILRHTFQLEWPPSSFRI